MTLQSCWMQCLPVPPRKKPELPDRSGGKRWEQLNENWRDVSREELQRRHDLAHLLVAGRLPKDYLQGCSTGAMFDD